MRQAPTRKILPGDLICGECGEGNPSARKFCSRCGHSLSEAQVAKTPWWKRLVPRRRRKQMAAGERPWKSKEGKQRRSGIGGKLAKVYVKARPLAAAVLLLAGLLYGVAPDIRGKVNDRVSGWVDSVQSWIRPEFVTLSPVSVSATSEIDGAGAELAIDSNTLTSWIAAADDSEPTLLVRFDEPFDLERIKIWNGAAEGFKDHPRIAKIHFVFDTGQSFDLAVDDLPEGREYKIGNGKGVREAELHVVEAYSSLTGDELALSEIEFFYKR